MVALHGQDGSWLVYFEDGTLWAFNQVSIQFDTSLFLVLSLIGEDEVKKKLVFHDQLDVDALKSLRVYHKLTKKMESL